MGFGVVAGVTDATVQITPQGGYAYYQIYWRESGEAVNQESGWLTGAPLSYQITGLDPNTSYTVNVGYNNTGAGGADGFMGAQTFVTNPTPQAAHIGDGAAWRPGTLYIGTGSDWVKYEPKVGDGTRWMS